MEVAFVVHQADLGINHDIAAFRQMNNDVGVAALTRLIFECNLRVILTALAQAGVLKQFLKNKLAPSCPALYYRRAVR